MDTPRSAGLDESLDCSISLPSHGTESKHTASSSFVDIAGSINHAASLTSFAATDAVTHDFSDSDVHAPHESQPGLTAVPVPATTTSALPSPHTHALPAAPTLTDRASSQLPPAFQPAPDADAFPGSNVPHTLPSAPSLPLQALPLQAQPLSSPASSLSTLAFEDFPPLSSHPSVHTEARCVRASARAAASHQTDTDAASTTLRAPAAMPQPASSVRAAHVAASPSGATPSEHGAHSAAAAVRVTADADATPRSPLKRQAQQHRARTLPRAVSALDAASVAAADAAAPVGGNDDEDAAAAGNGGFAPVVASSAVAHVPGSLTGSPCGRAGAPTRTRTDSGASAATLAPAAAPPAGASADEPADSDADDSLMREFHSHGYPCQGHEYPHGYPHEYDYHHQLSRGPRAAVAKGGAASFYSLASLAAPTGSGSIAPSASSLSFTVVTAAAGDADGAPTSGADTEADAGADTEAETEGAVIAAAAAGSSCSSSTKSSMRARRRRPAAIDTSPAGTAAVAPGSASGRRACAGADAGAGAAAQACAGSTSVCVGGGGRAQSNRPGSAAPVVTAATGARVVQSQQQQQLSANAGASTGAGAGAGGLRPPALAAQPARSSGSLCPFPPQTHPSGDEHLDAAGSLRVHSAIVSPAPYTHVHGHDARTPVHEHSRAHSHSQEPPNGTFVAFDTFAPAPSSAQTQSSTLLIVPAGAHETASPLPAAALVGSGPVLASSAVATAGGLAVPEDLRYTYAYYSPLPAAGAPVATDLGGVSLAASAGEGTAGAEECDYAPWPADGSVDSAGLALSYASPGAWPGAWPGDADGASEAGYSEAAAGAGVLVCPPHAHLHGSKGDCGRSEMWSTASMSSAATAPAATAPTVTAPVATPAPPVAAAAAVAAAASVAAAATGTADADADASKCASVSSAVYVDEADSPAALMAAVITVSSPLSAQPARDEAFLPSPQPRAPLAHAYEHAGVATGARAGRGAAAPLVPWPQVRCLHCGIPDGVEWARRRHHGR